MTSADGGGVDGGFEATSDEVERGCGAPIHPPPPKRRRQMVGGVWGGRSPPHLKPLQISEKILNAVVIIHLIVKMKLGEKNSM